MTHPENTAAVVDFDRFWPSYRHHLVQVLEQVGVWNLLADTALAGVTVWLAYTALQHESLATAALVGVVSLFLASQVWAVLYTAAEDTVAAQPWYGVGRTVHHPLLGPCRVLDHDTREEVEMTWVLIQPQEDAASWVPVSALDGTAVIRVEFPEEK